MTKLTNDLVIELFDGSVIPFSENTIKINHKYYEKDISCYLVNDKYNIKKWLPFDSEYLFKCEFDNKYYHKDYIHDVVVGVENKKRIIKKKGSIDDCFEVRDAAGTLYYYLNQNLVDQFCIEDNRNNNFIEKFNLTDAQILQFSERIGPPLYGTLGYYLTEDSNIYVKSKEGNDKFLENIEISNIHKILYSELHDLTVGMELESSNGHIPMRYLSKYGFVPLRDGSTGGGAEFSSLIIDSPGMIYCIDQFMNIFKKRCVINNKCGLHFHIGNWRTGNKKNDIKFIIALYTLVHRLQNELIIFYRYRKTKDYLSDENISKDYIQNLPRLPEGKDKYNWIFKLYSDGYHICQYNDQTKEHPKGYLDKWNYRGRYYLLNLWNIFFGKNDTIEFRPHPSTKSKDRVFLWMLICAKIVQYTKKNIEKILDNKEKITLLDDILSKEYFCNGEIREKIVKCIEVISTVVIENSFNSNSPYEDEIPDGLLNGIII